MMIVSKGSKTFTWAAFLACILVANAGAFVVRTNLGCGRPNEMAAVGQHPMIPSSIVQDFNVMRTTIAPSVSSSLLVSDAMVIVTNVLIGLGGIATLLVLLGFLATSYIIPTAVKQVETLATELDPDLWREYQQKLGPDETLATRPDLLQELGNKVLKLQQEQFEKEMVELEAEVESQENGGKGTPEQSKSRTDTIIDVDTTTTSKWDD
jgi:hypothetical protein